MYETNNTKLKGKRGIIQGLLSVLRLTPLPFRGATWLVLPKHLYLMYREENVVVTNLGS